MKLIHYTNTPLKEVEYREQDKDDFKPTGLWVSDEDDHGWRDWCLSENYHPEYLELAYEITLAEHHNVQIITTIEGIKLLTRIYSTERFRPIANLSLDWLRMRKDWNGLIITPYQWELRLDPDCMWYYPWDCASGCIWNPTIINSVVKEPKAMHLLASSHLHSADARLTPITAFRPRPTPVS